MFGAKLIGKILWTHKIRFLWLICLTVLLCTAAGLLGASFFYEKGAVSPVALVVVDEDDTLETRLVFASLKNAVAQEAMITLEKADREQAMSMLETGEATAAVLLPPGFSGSVRSGENKPFEILYSAHSPLKAQLVQMYADAMLRMLKSAQAGVYAALDYAYTYGGAQEVEQTLRDVNLGYMDLFGQRERMVRSEMLSVSGTVSLTAYYTAHVLVFLLTLLPVLLLDLVGPIFAPERIALLRRWGRGRLQVAIQGWLGIWPVYLGICGVLGAAMAFAYKVLPDIPRGMAALPACVLISVPMAALALLLVVLFRRSWAGGLFVLLFCLAELFVSGGILPFAYLAPFVQVVGKATLQYQASALLCASLGGGWDMQAVGGLLVWTAVGVLFSAGLLKADWSRGES